MVDQAFKSVDPKGKEDGVSFDHAGRRVKLVEAWDDGDYSTGDADRDRTTEWTYTADGQVATMTARNPNTGSQVTRYVYGTTTTESGVARSDLLRAVIYPDSDDVENPLGNGTDTVYDRVEYKYNRLGQQTEMKDQAGTVHAYDYDKLGRLTQDRVTAFGSGVDQTVKRIGRTYEVRGMLEKVTSYDHATVGQGSIVNEVQHAYNTFGQLVTEYQEHSGAVNTGTSLKTQYGYADGGSSSNHIRPTTLTYPKTSRVITLDYGTASAMNDVLSRVENVKESTTTYASYTYLGTGAIVRTDLPVPEVRLDLWGGTSGTYAGIDRFGRTVSHGWVYYNGGATDRDRFEYAYDRASNRLYKDNTLTTLRDEYYTYDNLHRLANMDRGTLNGGKTAIDGTPAREEQYTLDPTGNWATYLTKTSGTTDLDHDRDHNEANEVGTITTNTGSSWISPVHDPAGNMTQIPKPGTETTRLHLVYDAWNRMVIAKNDDGGSPGTTIATYGYDGKGRRIRKAINGGDTFDYYYNDDYQLLEVRKNADTDPLEHYVWDISYIDAPLIWFRDSNVDGTVDDTMYPARDANFNVTALIDTSGTVQERYFYDPYGKRTVLDGSWGARGSSSYDWTLGHQGLMLDGETGLYYNRARMLHGTLGRFLQRDPMGYVDGGSLYEYVRSTPSALRDPYGWTPWDKLYGLPKDFWHWAHRMGLLPGGGQQVSREEAMELFQEWDRDLKRPPADNKGKWRRPPRRGFINQRCSINGAGGVVVAGASAAAITYLVYKNIEVRYQIGIIQGELEGEGENEKAVSNWWQRNMKPWATNLLQEWIYPELCLSCCDEQKLADCQKEFVNGIANEASRVALAIYRTHRSGWYERPLSPDQMLKYLLDTGRTRVFHELDECIQGACPRP